MTEGYIAGRLSEEENAQKSTDVFFAPRSREITAL
jgi:hypothetical protein